MMHSPFKYCSVCHIALQQMVAMGRYTKRALLVANDLAVLTLGMWVGFSLRYNTLYTPPNWRFAALTMVAPVISVVVLFQMDLYRLVTRFIGARSINRIATAISLSTLIWALAIVLTGTVGVPRTVILLYTVFGTLGIWGTRQIASWLLKGAGLDGARPFAEGRVKVIVYGAGVAGIELANVLSQSSRFDCIGFVDQNRGLWGQYVNSFKVYRPDRLVGLIEKHDVKEILLALPHASRSERLSIIRSLEQLPVTVRTLPALEDIATGKVTVSGLRPVGANDLLGRDPVPPQEELLRRSILGKCVMVTGAGGSIGSEIVRQVLRQTPARLVLFDASESALYQIITEVQSLVAQHADTTIGSSKSSALEVFSVLGSVLDDQTVRRTIERHSVQTVYHAAAFKHVPIVEANPTEGLLNNTFGTIAVARAAEELGVERFVFISTDKAVRPTNVMGASKRLAEMALQSRAAIASGSTVFAIVRFGNVLDSSGSVVQLFRKQIEVGGPVTITHPDIIRYFMSIPEAASLVIQAGAMATGGEVFVLEMGEPVKINDLARSMIRLMGLDVRDSSNPNGDIAIEYVGLRPGEKLFEELFLGDTLISTEHPRIKSSCEPLVPAARLEQELAVLRSAIAKNDPEAMRGVLSRLVEGYQPSLSASAATATSLRRVKPASDRIN
jgi:FlaA1/EpsC-like NDP-sugar epimerase